MRNFKVNPDGVAAWLKSSPGLRAALETLTSEKEEQLREETEGYLPKKLDYDPVQSTVLDLDYAPVGRVSLVGWAGGYLEAKTHALEHLLGEG